MLVNNGSAFEPFTIVSLATLNSATRILRNGGIIAFPTDTIYGIGSDIYDKAAVSRIFSIKSRPSGLPLPVLISNLAQVESLTDQISPLALSLMQRFWPGGLTIIFNKSPYFDSPLLAGQKKIGIRMPAHPVPLWLINELGSPIVGTSANLHNREATLTAEEVRQQLGSKLDFIIDGGKCQGGIESTILDITCNPPRISRPGIISGEAIEEAIMDLL